MQYQPRDYQVLGVNHAIQWVQSAQPGEYLPLVSPTGTGKSVVELLIQQALLETHAPWIITPSVQIIHGLVTKLKDIFPEVYSYTIPERESDLCDLAWALHISTPVRFRNAMLRGEQEAPKLLLMDEGHHCLSNTTRDIDALSGYCPVILLTASFFRGTPKATAALYQKYGEPTYLLDIEDAIRLGYWQLPECKMLPCVDDDEIEINNGEFIASKVEAAVADKIEYVAQHCQRYYSNLRWDKPTMFALPSRKTARQMKRELDRLNICSSVLTGEATHRERIAAFSAMIAQESAVVQVKVAGEGVDIPELARLIDLQPTMSPVQWIQLFGRLTRPKLITGEYICTNRNLFRHAYILDGAIPPHEVLSAANAFPVPSSRAGGRVVGLESLGRLRAVPVPYKTGVVGQAYFVSTVVNSQVTEYACVTHPCYSEIIWAKKVRQKGSFDAKWIKTQAPDDLAGFASISAKAISEKQANWWKRSAKAFGLDETAEVNNKNFQVLPVFAQLNWRRWR
jgi:superfamily II DNA or RNA helicase